MTTATPPSVMDPQARQLAGVYATALLDAADPSAGEELAGQLDTLSDLMQPDDAAALFDDPARPPEVRRQLAERVFAGRVAPPVLAMLALMASKGRMGLLGEVARAVHRQLEQRAGRIEVTVTTALALDADRQQAITQMLQEALSAPPAVTWQVDPDLLGGLRVQVDDAVYDASLAGRLGQLVDRMSHRRTQERPQP